LLRKDLNPFLAGPLTHIQLSCHGDDISLTTLVTKGNANSPVVGVGTHVMTEPLEYGQGKNSHTNIKYTI
jgi:hypothetical protein